MNSHEESRLYVAATTVIVVAHKSSSFHNHASTRCESAGSTAVAVGCETVHLSKQCNGFALSVAIVPPSNISKQQSPTAGGNNHLGFHRLLQLIGVHLAAFCINHYRDGIPGIPFYRVLAAACNVGAGAVQTTDRSQLERT